MIKAKKRVPLNKDEVLARVKEEDIFSRYFIKPEYGKLFTNPLRKDNNPGCSFFVGEMGRYKDRLLFHDHAMGKTYDCFSMVMKKYNLNFWETLKKINEDFDLNLNTHYARSRIERDVKDRLQISSQKPLIQAITRDFTKNELEYWKAYGISLKTLKHFGVHAAEQVYVNKKLVGRSTEKNPIFVFEYPNNEVKIYRPLHYDSTKKWFGNVTNGLVVGDNLIPFSGGELLIITSSHKDVMTLSELGYHAIAPATSENQKFNKSYIDSLKSYWDRIVIFYDNDGCFNPPKGISGKGKEAAKRLADRFDLSMIFTPDGEPKDISDYYKECGKKKTINLLIKILEK